MPAVVQFTEALRRNPGYKEAEENLRVAKAADALPARTVILSDRALHLILDDAWPNDWRGLPIVDAPSWGSRLRFLRVAEADRTIALGSGKDLAAPFSLRLR